MAGGLAQRLPNPGGLFAKLGPLFGQLGKPFAKLAPLFSLLGRPFAKLGPLIKPLTERLGALRDRLTPAANDLESQFHHVSDHTADEESDDHDFLPPAFEHVAEHMPEKRRTALVAGLGVLGLGFLIGLGIWLLGGSQKSANEGGDGTPSMSLPMPPRAGPGTALLNPTPLPQTGPDGTPAPSPQAEPPAQAQGPGEHATPAEPPLEGSTPPAHEPPSAAGEPEPPPPAGTPATASKAAIPDFQPPSLKETARTNQTSLSPVAGEPRLPINSGQLSIPKLADLPAPPPPAQPVPMPEAPQSALLRKTDSGSLPTVAPDGREAWKTYARPFDLGDKRPRIAVVVYGLGLLKEVGEAALSRLPPEVSLSFSPYALKPNDWVERAHAAGHETLLDLPMDSRSFPFRDPGPLGLISSLSSAENVRRLDLLLTKAQGYNGLVASGGQRFLGSSQQVDGVFRELKKCGLLFVDNGLSGTPEAQMMADSLELPYVKANIMIDDRHFRTAIDIRLRKAEDDAHAKGSALVLIPARPLAMDRVAAWVKDLPTRGIALAPVSAVVASKPHE